MKKKFTIQAETKPVASLSAIHTTEVLRLESVRFTLIILIALLSPLLGLYLQGLSGVGVGIAINTVSLAIGIKAEKKIIRETHFRA